MDSSKRIAEVGGIVGLHKALNEGIFVAFRKFHRVAINADGNGVLKEYDAVSKYPELDSNDPIVMAARRLGTNQMSVAASILGANSFYGKTAVDKPIPMILNCPICNARHIDRGEFELKVHHTHACQSCGQVWRPAVVATVGVQFLPGFKN